MRRFFTVQMLELITASFFYMASIMMIGPVVATLCAGLGGGGALMGLTGGLSNAASLVCRPFLGNLIDRKSRRRLGLAGLACMSLGAGLCAAAQSVGALLLGRVFTGGGYALCSGALSTLVASSLSEENVGQGMGLYGLVQAVAQAVSPAFGLWVASAVSARATCAAASLLAVAGCVFLLPVRERANPGPPGGTTPPGEGEKRPLFLPELLPIALVVFLFCSPYNGTSAFLSTVASERGLSFPVGSFFTIYALFLLAVRVVLSRVIDRVPFQRIVLFCVPFGAASMLCLHWMRSRWQMVLAAFLLTLAYGTIQPVCQAAGVKSVDRARHGVANCTYYMGLDLGLSLGPVIAGVIYQALGQEYLFLALAFIPLLAVPAVRLCRFQTGPRAGKAPGARGICGGANQ